MNNPCKEIYVDIESGGWKQNELCVLATGRRTGKSIVDQYIRNWHMIFEDSNPSYKVLTTATVDGANWYTVHCTKDIAAWIRETLKDQKDKQWFQNIDDKWMLNADRFDMHEELYTMLQLRW